MAPHSKRNDAVVNLIFRKVKQKPWATPGWRLLRSNGLRLVIYINDHLPAHVHVFGDGEAKINLVGTHVPDLVWADNMPRSEVRRAMKLVAEQAAVLLQKWKDINGRTD